MDTQQLLKQILNDEFAEQLCAVSIEQVGESYNVSGIYDARNALAGVTALLIRLTGQAGLKVFCDRYCETANRSNMH